MSYPWGPHCLQGTSILTVRAFTRQESQRYSRENDLHRPLPDKSNDLLASRVLTRAQQDGVWDRIRMTNHLRALLNHSFRVRSQLRGAPSTALKVRRPEGSCEPHRHRRWGLRGAPASSRHSCGVPGAPVASPPKPVGCSSSSEPNTVRQSVPVEAAMG